MCPRAAVVAGLGWRTRCGRRGCTRRARPPPAWLRVGLAGWRPAARTRTARRPSRPFLLLFGGRPRPGFPTGRVRLALLLLHLLTRVPPARLVLGPGALHLRALGSPRCPTSLERC